MLTSANGTEYWVALERLWKFEIGKMLSHAGFITLTVHQLAQSIHPLRYYGPIQHWLQACSNAKVIIQKEIQIQNSGTAACCFGPVRVRNLVSRCLNLNSLKLQTVKLTVLHQLLSICQAIRT